MATTPFDEEFQLLSNLPQAFLDEFSEHDQFTAAINKLRRKSAQHAATENDLMDEDGKKFLLSRPTDQGQYQPVKNVMRILDEQLVELFDSVDSGGNLEVAVKIGPTLDRLGSFVNAIRLASLPGKEDPGTAISHLRNRHLFTECNFFLENLASIFTAYIGFLRDSRTTNPRNVSGVISRAHLAQRIEPTPKVTKRLIEMFDQSSLKMFQDEWISFVGIIRNLIEQSHREINLPEVINNPRKQRIRSQLKELILVLKLSRLLMNKLYKFTNPKPHQLGSKMCFDQLEKLQTEMCYMIKSLMLLFQVIKIPDPEEIPEVTKELMISIEDACASIKKHLETLDLASPDGHSIKMLCWLEPWEISYSLSTQRITALL